MLFSVKCFFSVRKWWLTMKKSPVNIHSYEARFTHSFVYHRFVCEIRLKVSRPLTGPAAAQILSRIVINGDCPNSRLCSRIHLLRLRAPPGSSVTAGYSHFFTESRVGFSQYCGRKKPKKSRSYVYFQPFWRTSKQTPWYNDRRGGLRGWPIDLLVCLWPWLSELEENTESLGLAFVVTVWQTLNGGFSALDLPH